MTSTEQAQVEDSAPQAIRLEKITDIFITFVHGVNTGSKCHTP